MVAAAAARVRYQWEGAHRGVSPVRRVQPYSNIQTHARGSSLPVAHAARACHLNIFTIDLGDWGMFS